MSPYYGAGDTMRARPLAALDAETVSQIDQIKETAQVFHDVLRDMPQSAEMTLAKRKIEEAVMWAVKAVTA